eukprot:gene24045-5869_t
MAGTITSWRHRREGAAGASRRGCSRRGRCERPLGATKSAPAGVDVGVPARMQPARPEALDAYAVARWGKITRFSELPPIKPKKRKTIRQR